jgi:hypothetical protein
MHKPDLSSAFNDGYKLKSLLPWRGIILTASAILAVGIIWRVCVAIF